MHYIHLPNCVNSPQLQCVEGNIIVASGENVVEVPSLKPNEQGELAVPFIAPAAPGHYERCVYLFLMKIFFVFDTLILEKEIFNR